MLNSVVDIILNVKIRHMFHTPTTSYRKYINISDDILYTVYNTYMYLYMQKLKLLRQFHILAHLLFHIFYICLFTFHTSI